MEDVLYIGVDVGGTNIKAGAVSEDGKIIKEFYISTEADRGALHIINRINQLIKDVATAMDAGFVLHGIGIGVPGQIDVEHGICHYAPNLPRLKEINIVEPIVNMFGCPVILDNDANMAAIGEFAFGAGKGSRNMLMVTLGTGVGGGLIINGEIFRGVQDMAGEFGHILVDMDGHCCSCGRLGCLEEYTSIRGIERMVYEALDSGVESSLRNIEHLTPREIYHDAMNGDALAIEVFQKAGDYLGMALTDVANLLNIECVVVGGGIANAGDLILNAARERVLKDAMPLSAQSMKIIKAQLGNSAGLVGAAHLARTIDPEKQ